jgi:Ribbon-helix-helix protein, copG family
MNQSKKKLESVKINAEVVALVRANKEKNGASIGWFFEQAALDRLKQKNKKRS